MASSSSSSSPRRPSKSSRSYIKYSWIPLDVKPLHPHTNRTKGEPHAHADAGAPGTILTTAELVSALGGLWRAVGHADEVHKPAPVLDRRARFGPKRTDASRWSPGSDYRDIMAVKRSLLTGVCSGSLSKITRGTAGMSQRFFCDLKNLVSGKSEGKELDPGCSVDSVCSVISETDAAESNSAYADQHIEFLVAYDSAVRECRESLSSLHMGDVALQEAAYECVEDANSEVRPLDVGHEEGCDPETLLSTRDKLSAALARRKYALAGALAGTFVSLCLHPIDTVKTVVQAQSTNGMSISSTFRSIVSERGLRGLYRGIASNIAFAAPTSAVYTFTYETVKGALLPLLPMECHSFAHCTAGGCASIATSFIFTPSERIKQQMQVRSHYQNCWNALVGILEKGGLPSLYAGWGAVLCRNVPHSIIKFYTYESLKRILLPSAKSDVSLSTLQTLLCGGIAGSTAALFTTPFDVVKTRLQTQMPGSLTKHGVFHMLHQIARHEGLSGLYRGLSPRLAMYISQGAIFFASYEFFKAVFSLEVPVPAKVDINQ